MKFFRTPLRPGQPWSTPGTAAGIAAMAHALETAECQGGTVRWHNGRMVIYPAKGGGGSGVDLSLFGIEIDNTAGTVTISERRIKRQQPDSYEGTMISHDVTEDTLNFSDAELTAPGTEPVIIWLNYNLDATPITAEYSFDEGIDSAVRLYGLSVTRTDGGESADTYTATVTRIYRPGDVDIEPMWLDYEEPTP